MLAYYLLVLYCIYHIVFTAVRSCCPKYLPPAMQLQR